MPAVVIVPTYNEVETVGALVCEVRREFPDLDILVVDDDSPDGTGRLVEGLARKDPRIRLLRRSGPRGFARAYIAGFKDTLARGYDVICQMDCDLQHPPRFLHTFLQLIPDHDVVIGSRYSRGGSTQQNWPIHRWLVSRGGNLYARTILGLPLEDLTGGFKCWRAETLAAIDLDHIMADGFAFQMEMNYRAHKKGFRIKEIPIEFPWRTAGKSKMTLGEFWESLKMPWRLRLNVR